MAHPTMYGPTQAGHVGVAYPGSNISQRDKLLHEELLWTDDEKLSENVNTTYSA